MPEMSAALLPAALLSAASHGVIAVAGAAGLLALVASVAALRPVLRRSRRPHPLPRLAELSGLAAFLLALAALAGFLITGPQQVIVQTGHPLADLFMPGLRLDAVSVTMLVLVSFIGWIVLRYSRTYLDGEARQGAFTGWLCLTLAAVILLVSAATLAQIWLAWVMASQSLMQLLRFYPERPGVTKVLAKKRLSAWTGDAVLLAGVLALGFTYGTGDIAAILAEARMGEGGTLVVAAAALIALAACLKSAQFPLHGWLTEVMEAPTPVSALLHAGVINAGGFLLVRFADVMLLSPGVLALLVVIGGFTALFGALVMLTQPLVKTALAWSTVAQMGFMVLQCGFGLFHLALLHIVAHSLYKAHAFLSSGTAVEAVTAASRPGPVAVPEAKAVARAFALAVGVYALAAAAFGWADKPPQALALGVILIFGVAYLMAQGLAGAAPRGLMLRTIAASLATAAAYFAFHGVAAAIYGGTLPPVPEPGPLETALLLLSLATFGVIAVTQAMFPLWAAHPAAAGLRVHLANGLYVNALLDRWLARPALRS